MKQLVIPGALIRLLMGKPKPYRVEHSVYEQGGSLLIVVPKIWADAHNLGKGDRVEIEFNGDGDLVVRPAKVVGLPIPEGEESP